MTRRLVLGITPLVDCAPVAVALERGFFAREGLRVTLWREPSWANIRDKLATGALDGAHMLAPMTLAASLGLEPVAEPAVTALSLGLGGNAITVSRALHERLRASGLAESPPPAACAEALARVLAEDRAAARPALRIASVFPFSMHHYELRFWLASAGIAPDRDVRIPVVPPPLMVAELEAGADRRLLRRRAVELTRGAARRRHSARRRRGPVERRAREGLRRERALARAQPRDTPRPPARAARGSALV